jgi:hypothetical protein
VRKMLIFSMIFMLGSGLAKWMPLRYIIDDGFINDFNWVVLPSSATLGDSAALEAKPSISDTFAIIFCTSYIYNGKLNDSFVFHKYEYSIKYDKDSKSSSDRYEWESLSDDFNKSKRDKTYLLKIAKSSCSTAWHRDKDKMSEIIYVPISNPAFVSGMGLDLQFLIKEEDFAPMWVKLVGKIRQE